MTRLKISQDSQALRRQVRTAPIEAVRDLYTREARKTRPRRKLLEACERRLGIPHPPRPARGGAAIAAHRQPAGTTRIWRWVRPEWVPEIDALIERLRRR